LVLVLSATCHCAWAQGAPVELSATTVDGEREAPSGVQLDTPIATGSRLGLTARETPASVSVSDRRVIEQRDARDSQEVINAMTGVNASANPGYGGFVTYRGFTQNQVTQLYNGINLGYSSATRPVDAWVIDRVELLGGPSSFLHGAGAVGGSINYISKLASRDQQTVDGRIRYGSYDEPNTPSASTRRWPPTRPTPATSPAWTSAAARATAISTAMNGRPTAWPFRCSAT
jgi:iron complex outermembrane receptor protein